MNEVIVLKPSKTWRIIAHNLEHLDPKKPPSMVECYGQMEFDLSKLLREIERSRHGAAIRGVWLRLTALVALAARRVLTRGQFRLLNGYWNACAEDRDKDTIALYKEVHIGISYDEGIPATIDEEKGTVDGPRLCIPTLHDPSMELISFLTAFDDLMRRIRADHGGGMLRLRKTKLSELLGHTFIFNNIGALGHTAGGSRLTARTAAMLNMGVVDKERGTAPFQLFFDHRICDGSMVTRFLKAVHQELEHIATEIHEQHWWI